MEKENKHYMESLNHDPNWLDMITIEIDKFLIDREYVNFFMQIYMQWSMTTVLLHPPKHWSFHVWIVLRNWCCHNYSYIEVQYTVYL